MVIVNEIRVVCVKNKLTKTEVNSELTLTLLRRWWRRCTKKKKKNTPPPGKRKEGGGEDNVCGNICGCMGPKFFHVVPYEYLRVFLGTPLKILHF